MNKIKTLLYLLKLTFKLTPKYIPKPLISAVFRAVTPFLNIILVRYIIEELMGNQDQSTLIKYVLILVVGNFLLRIINMYFKVSLNIDIRKVHNNFSTYLGKKCTEIDFENIEDVEILDLKEKAYFAIFNLNAIGQILEEFANAIYSVFVISGLLYLLFVLNPILILVIAIAVTINALIFRYISILVYNVDKNAVSGNRAYMYYLNLSSDFSIAKDIRLYQGSNMLVNRIKSFTDRLLAKFSPFNIKKGKLMGTIKVINQIQMVLIYVYLAYGVMNKSISIGELTMYAGAVSTLSFTLSAMTESIININLNCQHLDFFIKFDKLESKVAGGDKSVKHLEDMTIEFKDVSFKYPRNDEWVLKNINIMIKQGEKLSIVGLNGAGKTTFIKLLSRLYQPTSGTISIGGVDINEIDKDEYMELLGVVFQDFKLLSYTIKENLSNNQGGEKKIIDSLNKAGFDKDLKVLDKGIDTSVYKSFDKSGIEFSGGQLQKLALARTLYKNSPILVLDEPTSALDPISEYEVYSNFNSMVEDSTAIYISHRLSSTRLSDNIAVFKSGEIVEYGSHNDLINNDMLYAEMYNTQSKYYI